MSYRSVFVLFGVLVWAGAAGAADRLAGLDVSQASPGTSFKDCDVCPEMVVVPAGSFRMGTSPSHEGHRNDNEGPVRQVTIPRAFAVGKYEVTFAEWDACVAGGGCNGYRPDDRGWGRGSRPVIKVSWQDANAYAAWLSRKTGKAYRLLSEAEWEYAARAGTTTARHWGDEIGVGQANCDGCGSRWDNEETAPVGSFPANAFGLHDMLGNVFEWTADCWNGSYAGAPSDGSAWTTGDCEARVRRGGTWTLGPVFVRAAHRGAQPADGRSSFFGFRVARTD